MHIQLQLGLVSESASKKKNVEKAKALFGKKGESVYSKLKSLESTKELVMPNLSKLLEIIDKASVEDMEKLGSRKSTDSVASVSKRLSSAKSLDGVLKAYRDLKIPKVLSDILKVETHWGMKKTEKYTPKVQPASAHGDELKKLEYVKESKAHFTQHIKDGLLSHRSDLELITKSGITKDPNNANKPVGTTEFYARKGKKDILIGCWYVGGRGWHYDRLPKSIAK